FAQEVDSIAELKQQLIDLRNRLDAQEQINNNLLEKKNRDKIWGKGRYTNLAYGVSACAKQDGFKFNSDWNFSLAKGTSYLFPNKPFFNMLKVGFDIRWFEISATKYKSNSNYSGGSSWYPDYGYDDWYDDWYDDYEIGHYDVHIGAFGIGPVVSVAPFSSFNNGLRFLRATLYFHYQPTIGLHVMSEDGEVEGSMAYCNMMDFGGKIQWRWIALGVEGKWGSGKFSSLVDSDDFDYDYDYDYDYDSSSTKRKFSSTRLYISFTF
ncbi:MAG: hypothetical protein K2H32_05220, partial [Muribaculaceae bacterium]|nr:hypothetical protein [Muribaculaceae bacterium]